MLRKAGPQRCGQLDGASLPPGLDNVFTQAASTAIACELSGHEPVSSFLCGRVRMLVRHIAPSPCRRNRVTVSLPTTNTHGEAWIGLPPPGLAICLPPAKATWVTFRAGLCRWAFDELAKIAEMKFRFAEEEDACEYVTRLAADLPVRADELQADSYPLPAWRIEPVFCF